MRKFGFALLASALLAAPAMAQQGGVKVGGNLTNTTSVGSAVNAAIGKGNTACMELGTIGDTACR